MTKRVQLPVVGGLRKSVIVGATQSTNLGTTIQEFANQSISLAQLKAALGITTTPNTIGGGSGSGGTPAVLVVGAGLTGGGPLIGSVALGLNLPPRVVNKGANWVSTVALTSGANIVYVQCPLAAVIQQVQIVTSGGPGSCVVDVWKAPFSAFPPTSGNSITASAKPTISSGVKYVDSTLTGWTKNINAGDVLAFFLQSVSTFTQVQIVLEVQQ
jgi:hypothetical protein